MPAASTRPRSTPASSISSDTSRRRRVEGVFGGGVDLELREGLGQDRVGEVRDGDAQRVVAEVEPDDGSGRAVERDQHGRAAALRARRGDAVGRALDDHPRGLEVADEARHGRATQARLTGDIGAADGPTRAQRVDDAQTVALAERLQRPGAELTHWRDPLP